MMNDFLPRAHDSSLPTKLRPTILLVLTSPPPAALIAEPKLRQVLRSANSRNEVETDIFEAAAPDAIPPGLRWLNERRRDEDRFQVHLCEISADQLNSLYGDLEEGRTPREGEEYDWNRFNLIHSITTPTQFDVIVADYHFRNTPEDQQLLRALGRLGSRTRTPVLCSVSEEFFGLDAWSDFQRFRDPRRVTEAFSFQEWNALRASPESEWIYFFITDAKSSVLETNAEGRPGDDSRATASDAHRFSSVYAAADLIRNAAEQTGTSIITHGPGGMRIAGCCSTWSAASEVDESNASKISFSLAASMRYMGLNFPTGDADRAGLFFPFLTSISSRKEVEFEDVTDGQTIDSFTGWQKLSNKLIHAIFHRAILAYGQSMHEPVGDEDIVEQINSWLGQYVDSYATKWMPSLPGQGPFRPLKSAFVVPSYSQSDNETLALRLRLRPHDFDREILWPVLTDVRISRRRAPWPRRSPRLDEKVLMRESWVSFCKAPIQSAPVVSPSDAGDPVSIPAAAPNHRYRFSLGAIVDLYGDKKAPPVRERRFQRVSLRSCDAMLRSVQPELLITLSEQLRQAGFPESVRLNFTDWSDFTGDGIRRQLDSQLAELQNGAPSLVEQVVKTVVEAEKFEALLGNWWCVRKLAEQTDECFETFVLHLTAKEASKDIAQAPEFDTTQLFRLIYDQGRGAFDGTPLNCVVFNHQFDHFADSIELLSGLSAIAAAAGCVLLTSASSSIFGVDQWNELDRVQLFGEVFRCAEYGAWRSFRQSADSKYVFLLVPQLHISRSAVCDSANVSPIRDDEDSLFPVNAAWIAALHLKSMLSSTPTHIPELKSADSWRPNAELREYHIQQPGFNCWEPDHDATDLAQLRSVRLASSLKEATDKENNLLSVVRAEAYELQLERILRQIPFGLLPEKAAEQIAAEICTVLKSDETVRAAEPLSLSIYTEGPNLLRSNSKVSVEIRIAGAESGHNFEAYAFVIRLLNFS